jgi:hypothetical protein
MTAVRWAALVMTAMGVASPVLGGVKTSPIAQAEALYADWLDAVSALATVDSGFTPKVAGRAHNAWAARVHELTAKLDVALAAADADASVPEEVRVLKAIRKGLTDNEPDVPLADPEHPAVHCADAARRGAAAATLQVALYACFEEIGSRIDFEGHPIVRTTALQLLQQLPDGAQRKRLFLALAPLWLAVNGDDTLDSPYRRMMMSNGTEAQNNGRSPIANAAVTLGIKPPDVERWLVQVLEAWRARSPGPALEPWDYWYASAAASRELSAVIPREAVLATAKRFYRDLGADLDRLRVQHDLDVRPGKAPLAYTDQIRIGRRMGNTWRPTLTRVSGNYEQGGLFVLNELIHEDGHAVHFEALRTRPAFFSLGDELFFEAFADVPAWSSSEPLWQQKYLGRHAAEGSALRELFSNVMFDVAWSLFELRMLEHRASDPNLLWTDITAGYLNIVPHPELSWWALRVQLVRWPGYMINYGLGAVVTADIRQRMREAIGQFDTGNLRWYGWTSAHLLRFGSSVETSQLLRRFLGRSVSPDAILRQLQRVGSVDVPAGQQLGQAVVEQLDRFIHIRLLDDQRRHEAHRALSAREQDQAVVISPGDQGIAEFPGRLLARPVLHQFDADHEALAPHLSDNGEFVREQAQPAHEVVPDLGRVGAVFTLDEIDGRERSRATHWISAERIAVSAAGPLLHDAALGDDHPDGQARAESLRQRHDVRCNIPVLRGEHLARAADAGLNFIEDQQDPVPVAEFAQAP